MVPFQDRDLRPKRKQKHKQGQRRQKGEPAMTVLLLVLGPNFVPLLPLLPLALLVIGL